MDNYPEFDIIIKKKVLANYIKQIRKPLLKLKNIDI